MNIIQKASVFLIRWYRKYLSLDHGPLSGVLNISVCIYEPTCSEYTEQAIIKYGFWKGGFIGLWRILRCNPWAKGGKDLLK